MTTSVDPNILYALGMSNKMGRTPLPRSKKKSFRITVPMEPSLGVALRRAASREGVLATEWIRQMIRKETK